MVERTVVQSPGAVTFRVDEVEVASQPLRTGSGLSAYSASLLDAPIEAASDLVGEFLPLGGHGLVSTVERAFLDHRPLILGPDAIWQTLAQGFADHVNHDAEGLRKRFVPHEGKRKLVVPADLVGRSPENPWGDVFERFARLVRRHVHEEVSSILEVDFSTSTPVDRVARALVLMDAFQAYFEYEAYCICGIPWIRLEGTTADWELVAEKVEGFSQYGLGWWTRNIAPILEQFIRASRGEIDRAFWQSIFQRRDEDTGDYGGPTRHVSGWIVRLVPYLGVRPDVVRNPVVLGQAREIYPGQLQRGYAQVPFVLKDVAGRTEMRAFAGIVGIAQDSRTRALKPKIGWAVMREPPRPTPEDDAIFAKQAEDFLNGRLDDFDPFGPPGIDSRGG